MINKENEKKIILTEEEYLNINSKFEKIEEKNQINYYFDTQNYGLANNDETLRVRQSDCGLKLEYKFNKKYSSMIRECQEYSFSIKELPSEISSHIITPFYDRDKTKFFLQGQLVTYRKKFQLDRTEICLDSNYYLGKKDFELEIECEEPEEIEKVIEILGCSCSSRVIGKYKCFLRQKETIGKNILE